ncbi:MAG: DUF4232 domain-containing protein [Mycobacterium sp.]|uniref:DUF4232 domain-containing protein n=1 Tax=Mycobacterium sp. TaxID=1785 RepID=UPI003F9436BD
MPGPHGRTARRLVRGLAAVAAGSAGCAAAAMLGSPAWAAPPDTVDEPTPCWSDQVAVSGSPAQAAVGHRSVTLLFTLAGGAEPCTLTGYPGVDSGDGGPLIHAEPTPRGYLGGLPADLEEPPTVTLSISTQAQAIVEGMAVDNNGNPCPTYTGLLVNPPDISQMYTVPATIDACSLQVHPITAGG